MLLISADDWGRSIVETDAALGCYKAGRMTSVSAMVFMSDSERAAELSTANGLDVGLHLKLAEYFFDLSQSIPEKKLGPVLAEAGISTVLNYPKALPFYPACGQLGHTSKDFPIAHANRSRILSLPIYPEITDDMISYLAGKIAEFFRGSPQLNRGLVNPTMSRKAEWIG